MQATLNAANMQGHMITWPRWPWFNPHRSGCNWGTLRRHSVCQELLHLCFLLPR